MNPSSLAGHVIELLNTVVKTDVPADRVVSDYYRQRRYLGSHDRSWISDKLYRTIRNFILLREIGRKCAENPKALSLFLLCELLIYEVRVDELLAKYSSLLESYKLAGEKIDLDRLAACGLKHMSEFKASQNETLLNSFPEFFCDFIPEHLRQECASIMKALNCEAKTCLRVDTNKISVMSVLERLGDEGIEASPAVYSPFGLYLRKRSNLNIVELYRRGAIEIQEEASQLVGLIVDPRQNEIVVDACAGAGGKSLELASLSNGLSNLFSLDISNERLENLKRRFLRSGFKNIDVRVVAAGDFSGVEDLVGVADKVIVDAPCSGSGTIRRNPDKKIRLTRESVRINSDYQKKLLDHYSKLTKVGGMVYYSTCSIFEEENQRVVRSFVESNPSFQFVDVSQILSGEKFSNLVEDGFLAVYPHRAEMDGFFTAVMKRVS